MIADDRRRAAQIKNVLLVLCALAIVVGSVRLWRMMRDPSVAMLIGSGGAEWICFDSPPHLPARQPEHLVTFFRKTVRVSEAPASAQLIVQSFRLGNVQIDGVQILPPWDELSRWIQPRETDLARYLAPGEHTLLVEVFNQNAPPALLAHCQAIDLHSDATWDASVDGQTWTRARLAKSPRWADITSRFPSSGFALLKALPVLAPVFLIAIGVAAFIMRRKPEQRVVSLSHRLFVPSTLRWILLGAWIVLAINNIWKLPADVGFDAEAHLAYILFIYHYGKLPLATDGWQMFEAPLYYLVSLPIVKFALSSMDLASVTKLLRIIPLLCALAQVQICYRVMKLVFPQRRDLQSIGLLVGGLMPMLLYRSQTIGTEPIVGALTAATIWLALVYAYGSPRWRTGIGACAIGAVFGLALLTKISAILIAPLLVGWIFAIHWMNGERLRIPAQRIAIVISVAALIAGWYYARNWIELGKPFVGGWDPSRQIDWWQEPGYRTPEEFLRFGRALTQPAWASMAGFWDGLYSTMWTDGALSSMVLYDHRPPWNYSFALSASLLGMFPTALLLIGACMAVIGTQRNAPAARASAPHDHGGHRGPPPPAQHRHSIVNRGALVFSVFAIATYLAAIFHLHLAAPIHSTAKATYTLGLTPCYAMLIAAGLGMLARTPMLRAILIALLATWCVNSYAAFVII